MTSPLPRVTILLVLLLLIVGAGVGCNSIDHLIDPEQRLAMYGGTQQNHRILGGQGSAFAALISLIDYLPSLVGDTLLLPIVAPIVLLR